MRGSANIPKAGIERWPLRVTSDKQNLSVAQTAPERAASADPPATDCVSAAETSDLLFLLDQEGP